MRMFWLRVLSVLVFVLLPSFPNLAAADTWTALSSGVEVNLNGVHFVDPTHGCVFADRVILRTTNGGERWTQFWPDSPLLLRAIAGKSSEDVWYAVGTDGRILYSTNGGYYFREDSDVPRGPDLWDVQILPGSGYSLLSTAAIAVGDSGKILLKRAGEDHWSSIGTSISGISRINLRAVHFVDRRHGWIVGNNQDGSGRVLKTIDGGETWAVSNSTIPGMFQDIHAATATNLLASGPSGQVYSSPDGGFTWTPHGVSPSVAYSGINVTSTAAKIAGPEGTICTSPDGGVTWTEEETGTAADLKKIQHAGSNVWYAVGNGGTILRLGGGGRPAADLRGRVMPGKSIGRRSAAWASSSPVTVTIATPTPGPNVTVTIEEGDPLLENRYTAFTNNDPLTRIIRYREDLTGTGWVAEWDSVDQDLTADVIGTAGAIGRWSLTDTVPASYPVGDRLGHRYRYAFRGLEDTVSDFELVMPEGIGAYPLVSRNWTLTRR